VPQCLKRCHDCGKVIGRMGVLARMSRLEIAGKASLIFTIFGGSALMLGLAIIRFSQH